MDDKIPIVALCGFLGSGKTTLLRRWRRNEFLDDAVVIVNDLGEAGIDAEILSKEDKKLSAGKLNGRLAPLHGLYSHKYLQESFKLTLDNIFNLEPSVPLVLSESTGVARPWSLIKALTQDNRFFLRHFIVTVDALNLHRDFNDGLILTMEIKTTQDKALTRASYVLAEQISFASVIILTKIDMIDEATIQRQINNLKKIQPNVVIGLSAQAGLLLDQLDKVSPPDLLVLQEKAKKWV